MADRRGRVICLLLALAALAVAFVWLSPDTPTIDVDEESTSSLQRPEPPVHSTTLPGQELPTPPVPSATEGEPHPVVETEDASPDELANIWTPDYGPLLERSGSVVTFHVKDVLGVPLEGEPITQVNLWRLFGKYGIREQVHLDRKRNVITCEGLSRCGLEPGQYELQVDAAHYGAVTHRFHVGRGEKREDTIQTPNWRRIITLIFRDQYGQPVPYLVKEPTYTWDTPKRPDFPWYGTPDLVLRDPPGSGGAGGGGGGGACSDSWSRGC